MMRKPRLLDLFCGAGGAAMGYARAGFDVVGVDIAPQPHYPYTFIQADALTFSLNGFDVIHASPVCKGYTELNAIGKEHHQRLIPAMRDRLRQVNRPWVIENVEGAIHSLPGSMTLCGSMFGLRIWRHRLFESNCLLFAPGHCQHRNGCIGVYGQSIWDSSQRGKTRRDGRVRPAIVPLEIGALAMGIDRMTREELVQAIPPVYTAWLAPQLLAYVESEAA